MSHYAPGSNRSWNARFLALVIGAVAMTLLHLDFWRPQSDRLMLGWIPEELLYRVLYVFLASAYILWVCAWLPEAEEPGG